MNDEYDLAKSSKALGKLYPVLKDKRGNIIDGFHRLNSDPDWPCITVEGVDDDVTLELARLASNYCRRQIGTSEMSNKIAFFVKNGLKPEEIHEQTGISLTTIYKYMPQELKDQTKVEAGAASGVARSVPQAEHTVKTQDTSELGLCEVDNIATSKTNLKLWHGYLLCPRHYDKAKANPELYEQTLGYKKNEKNGKVPVGLLKPKIEDTWANRKARMSPQHSKFEEEVRVELNNHPELFPIIMDRSFCLVSTTPDYLFPKFNLAVYNDGQPHEGREDEDEKLRQMLTQRHNVEFLGVMAKGLNAKEFVAKILEKVKE